jgi:cytochrome c-type biogenesis protein CcsB
MHLRSNLATLLLVALITAVAPAALAQTAPAGNAHPATQAISESTTKFENPFGHPIAPSPSTTDTKRTLAAAVNLEPLRTLAVQHDGRVKILDTLARETIQRIAGRKNYQDFIPAEGGRTAKLSYDALFTFLDLLIDPAYYADKPLIHIEYLPLRQELLKEAFPDVDGAQTRDPQTGRPRLLTAAELEQNRREQERWLKLTRLSPSILYTFGETVRARHEFHLPYRQALDNAAMSLEIFQDSAANLLLVAAASPDSEYQHIATLPDGHPARAAAAALGQAWRAGDAARVNTAIATLASELPKINPQSYPTTRRTIEQAYNRANAFEWGYWIYALSFLTLILAFGTGRRPLIGLGVATLVAAIGLHAFGFITRCIIAERFAIQNQFESMTGISLFAAIVGLSIMLLKRQYLFGAAAAGVGFLVLITATQTAIPGKFIEREAAILNTSVLLKYHVTTVLCGYGLISLGFIVSLFYLGTYYASRGRSSSSSTTPSGTGVPPVSTASTSSPLSRPSAPPLSPAHPLTPSPAHPLAATALNLSTTAPAGPQRTLADLDKAQMTILQLAFWVLGTGILLGAWWADHSWGRWWAFDPKETWALATWIIYLIVIHLRFATGPKRALITAWLSVLGFVVMLWTYFGVNLLLPGLHAYA